MISAVTGVVLAGGKSTRMGRDKALLPYQGKNLIDAPIEILSKIFPKVVLSVKNDLPGYSLEKIVDQYVEIGPLGGITSVLKTLNEKIFCVACDMPHLDEKLIEHLCSFGEEAVIPVWQERPEVLHAIYSPSLIPAFEHAIASGRYKITDALAGASVKYITQSDGTSFQNVNTPSDYEKI